ncbi:MAG TPA: DUF5668 domain-containing protein [Bryobacteraceae bacterium]
MNPAPPNPPPIHPPPPPPQSHLLMRALTGPLVLTTLGVLLTIDYSGGITFGRSWPVLLIVFGLCKVAEHLGPRGW